MIGATLLSSMVLAVSPGACWPVAGSQILASDLAAANALFSRLHPDAAFGYAPLPGARRLLLGRELAAFARREGFPVENEPVADVCVERPVNPLNATDLSAVLAEAAGIPDARIELLDYSRQPVPRGRLEFHWNAIGAPPAGNPDIPIIWRGRLNYDGQHSLAVWAKVRISVERPVVVAAADLIPGHEIEAGQIRLVQMPAFPSRSGFLEMLEPALGKTVNRQVRAGQKLSAAALKEPDDIRPGQRVLVRVVDGSAYLSFEGTALSGGSKGAAISLRNPSGGRIFRGTVEDKGVVVVRSGGPA
jgi:flagella basal body P-ring formation protein FlgA